jgi:hypothetical protein
MLEKAEYYGKSETKHGTLQLVRFEQDAHTSAFKVMASRNKSNTTSCFFSPFASRINDSQ